jgi:hypothetical protein
VLWGTDSIWYGSPQDQIQAFRSFRIADELVERHGYPVLTPELKATFPQPRREIIASFLQMIHTWTPLGCDNVGDRGISRLRSAIEHICYAKGTGKQGSLLFTVPYTREWRAAGVDNVFGI